MAITTTPNATGYKRWGLHCYSPRYNKWFLPAGGPGQPSRHPSDETWGHDLGQMLWSAHTYAYALTLAQTGTDTPTPLFESAAPGPHRMLIQEASRPLPQSLFRTNAFQGLSLSPQSCCLVGLCLLATGCLVYQNLNLFCVHSCILSHRHHQ